MLARVMNRPGGNVFDRPDGEQGRAIVFILCYILLVVLSVSFLLLPLLLGSLASLSKYEYLLVALVLVVVAVSLLYYCNCDHYDTHGNTATNCYDYNLLWLDYMLIATATILFKG